MDFDFCTLRIFSDNEGEQYLENYLAQPKLRIGNVHIEQALSYFEEKQWFKALAACQKALTISADLPEAHQVWGDCLQRLGKTTEALGQYAQALELNPDMVEVYLKMGSLFAKQKKWNQALNHFQQALKINPRIAVVYRHLANIYHQLGEYESTTDMLYRAYELEPDSVSAQEYFVLGNMLLEQDKEIEAITCYRRAVQLKRGFYEAYEKLNDALRRRDEFDRQQEENLEHKAIPQEPERESGYYKSLEVKPDDPEAYIGLAQIKEAKGEKELALAFYKIALQIQPNIPVVYRHLANIYHQLGEYESTTDMLYRAYELEPDSVSAQEYFVLGNMLLEQDKVIEASACYRRAVNCQNWVVL